jgi:Fur family ferric uptake transcriptional regulator
MDVIHSKLDRNNYRLTDQRKAILDVMLENQGSHLSAEEVLWEAKKKFPNIGIATVYRTLEKLANLDILHKSMFED